MRPSTALFLFIGVWVLIIAAVAVVNAGYFGPDVRDGFLVFFGRR